MTKRHPAGIYEAVLENEEQVPAYRLRVTTPGGQVTEIDDPYRFGRILSDFDLYLFGEGNHTRIYDKLGAHPLDVGGTMGVHFSVWAPNALRVSVVGDFNILGRTRTPDAVARRERRVGDLHSRSEAR